MLGSSFALRNGYRVGWYSTAVLLPLTAIQGLMQASVLSFPLVALSIVSMPRTRVQSRSIRQAVLAVADPTRCGRGARDRNLVRDDRHVRALRDQFNGVETIVDAFYFTVVTASTVGYGDVTPVAGAAADIAQLFVLSSLVMNVAAFAVALGVILTPAIEGAAPRRFEK